MIGILLHREEIEMTKEEIEKLAYDCGFIDREYLCDNKFCGDFENLEKFANELVSLFLLSDIK